MEKHLTQKELAEKLKTKDGKSFAPSRVCDLEKGREIPSVEVALQIAEVLGCRVEDLYSR
jgi:DNA-binding XRE family transcriptional regulator